MATTDSPTPLLSMTHLFRSRYASAMEIGVVDLAKRLGVSERRARALVASGRLPGRRVSGRWLVEETAIPASRPRSRPMSARVAWELIWLLSDGLLGTLTQPELSRLRAKRRTLLADPDPASLLRSWLPRRAQLARFAIVPGDVDGLLADPRIVPSGISDDRADLSAGGDAEGYVHVDDLAGVASDHLLSKTGRPNVWLHLSDRRLPSPAPLGAVIADLADHDTPPRRPRRRGPPRRGAPMTVTLKASRPGSGKPGSPYWRCRPPSRPGGASSGDRWSTCCAKSAARPPTGPV